MIENEIWPQSAIQEVGSKPPLFSQWDTVTMGQWNNGIIGQWDGVAKQLLFIDTTTNGVIKGIVKLIWVKIHI